MSLQRDFFSCTKVNEYANYDFVDASFAHVIGWL